MYLDGYTRDANQMALIPYTAPGNDASILRTTAQHNRTETPYDDSWLNTPKWNEILADRNAARHKSVAGYWTKQDEQKLQWYVGKRIKAGEATRIFETEFPNHTVNQCLSKIWWLENEMKKQYRGAKSRD